ncbi:MAG: hypothetical protein PHS60_12960 [Zavarzinia sp.]|nr:hypothetical protein [Zavarzinia sp.]
MTIRAGSRAAAALSLVVWLAACAGVGIPATDDPEAKLAQARYLYTQAGRPARAEPLILEAMEQYRQAGDMAGLAMAHREYGFFLRMPGSDAIITAGGATGGPVAPDRLRRALGEVEEATRLSAEIGLFDMVSNTSLIEAQIHHDLGEGAASCAALTRSLSAGDRYAAAHPGGTPDLPSGVNSFAELIGIFRREYGCPAQ